MPTLLIRASHAWRFPDFMRIGSTIAMLFDVFAEAQQQARTAHARYPFVE
jgi:hypothetical protein